MRYEAQHTGYVWVVYDTQDECPVPVAGGPIEMHDEEQARHFARVLNSAQ